MSNKYRKKPVEIEAVLLNTDTVMDVLGFLCPELMCVDHSLLNTIREREYITIKTLEEEMRASFGDYIIKGVAGEFYPCRADIFEQTYEKAKMLV